MTNTYNDNEKALIIINVSEEKYDYNSFFNNCHELGMFGLQVNIHNFSQNVYSNLLNINFKQFKYVMLNVDYKNITILERIEENKGITNITINLNQINADVIKNINNIQLNKELQHCTIGVRIRCDIDYDAKIVMQELENINIIQYIILDLYYKINNKISPIIYLQKEDEILKTMRSSEKIVYLENGFFTKDYVIDHPCNIYLCSGKKCHTNKGALVRRIFIDCHGDIYPDFMIEKDYKIGNIEDVNLKEMIISDDFYKINKKFLKICSKIFFLYIVNWQSNILPWKYLLEETISKEK